MCSPIFNSNYFPYTPLKRSVVSFFPQYPKNNWRKKFYNFRLFTNPTPSPKFIPNFTCNNLVDTQQSVNNSPNIIHHRAPKKDMITRFCRFLTHVAIINHGFAYSHQVVNGKDTFLTRFPCKKSNSGWCLHFPNLLSWKSNTIVPLHQVNIEWFDSEHPIFFQFAQHYILIVTQMNIRHQLEQLNLSNNNNMYIQQNEEHGTQLSSSVMSWPYIYFFKVQCHSTNI